MRPNIEVSVEADYLSEQSDPGTDKYVFAYTVLIRNWGTCSARLLERHWYIEDSDGVIQEVRGTGVVGEQPNIPPGKGFQYTSQTIISTPTGAMHGNYKMVGPDGEAFIAEIPEFKLLMPYRVH